MFGLPMISLIYDFSTENSCGNVHKISVNHTCHKSLILLQTASARPKMWQMIQALSTPSTSLACETDFEAVNETHTNFLDSLNFKPFEKGLFLQSAV